jgi:hypothetical protein
MNKSKNNYDPTWVVDLFEKKLNPENSEAMQILGNLRHCTKPVCYCSCGCGDPFFIDPKGKDWKLKENITAYDRESEILVILDIMEDLSIGSIELQRDMPCDLSEMVVVEID